MTPPVSPTGSARVSVLIALALAALAFLGFAEVYLGADKLTVAGPQIVKDPAPALPQGEFVMLTPGEYKSLLARQRATGCEADLQYYRSLAERKLAPRTEHVPAR